MPQGKLKSRRFRRIFVKTPGSKTVKHYRKRKPSKAVCAIYGTPLAGVPHQRAPKLRNMPKSKKRPDRPFGGILSSKGMRFLLRRKARVEAPEEAKE
jgi:large subunit ribosomal protein L34e